MKSIMVWRILSFVFLSILAVTLYGYFRFIRLGEPMNSQGGSVEFKIEKGMTLRRIAETLKTKGYLDDPLAFELLARSMGADRLIKAGTYMVDLMWSPRRLLEAMRAGTLPKQIRVTIPEGFNRWQIADLLTEAGLVNRKEFLHMVAKHNLEGRLFPDTYLFRSDGQLKDVTDRLIKTFERVWSEINPRQTEEIDLQRVLTIASLVEREAKHPDEQKKIAKVFYNRLKKGMKLQTDPTCVYSELLYKEKPHPKYCKDSKNQYSTYVIKGLPPTPISNPGRSALKAALSPFEGVGADNLLYFVARGDGGLRHVFSTSYADHRKAVRAYVKRLSHGKPERSLRKVAP